MRGQPTATKPRSGRHRHASTAGQSVLLGPRLPDGQHRLSTYLPKASSEKPCCGSVPATTWWAPCTRALRRSTATTDGSRSQTGTETIQTKPGGGCGRSSTATTSSDAYPTSMPSTSPNGSACRARTAPVARPPRRRRVADGRLPAVSPAPRGNSAKPHCGRPVGRTHLAAPRTRPDPGGGLTPPRGRPPQ